MLLTEHFLNRSILVSFVFLLSASALGRLHQDLSTRGGGRLQSWVFQAQEVHAGVWQNELSTAVALSLRPVAGQRQYRKILAPGAKHLAPGTRETEKRSETEKMSRATQRRRAEQRREEEQSNAEKKSRATQRKRKRRAEQHRETEREERAEQHRERETLRRRRATQRKKSNTEEQNREEKKSETGQRATGDGHREPGTGRMGTRHWALDTRHSPGTGHCAPGQCIEHWARPRALGVCWAPDTGHRARGTRLGTRRGAQIPGTRHWARVRILLHFVAAPSWVSRG